ncbi:MAG: hypothetical protein K5756_06440 [Clostridiales bacterium]|nr:hypothetical protein [Clostridiales bacterium]
MKRIFSLIIAVILSVSLLTPAVFADDNTATYQIVTYCMDIYGDSYEIVSTEETTGIIDEYVSVTPEEIEGFEYNSYLSQPGDYVDRYGETILTLVYDRLIWTFTVYAGNTIDAQFETYYGAPIEDIENPFIDTERVMFEGWEEEIPETMPNHDFDLHAKLSPLGQTYVSMNGGTVTCNGQPVYGTKPYLSKLGTKVTLSATPDEGDDFSSEFIYWKNTETNRVVSFDPVYSFNSLTYMDYIAMFYISYDSEYHYVAYLNLAGNVLLENEYAIGEEITPPTPTLLPGYNFDHWSIDAETASNTPGTVIVRPIYNKIEGTQYTVILTNEYGVSGAGIYDEEELVTISAANREDFSYWIDNNGEIVSYYPTYNFTIVYDAVFTAVFYAPEQEKIACRIVKDVPNTTDHIITVYEEWSVDTAYTVDATGFIATSNASIGSDKDQLQIGTSGISKTTSTETTQNGIYSLRVGGWTSGRTYYFRPYVIVHDASGQHSVYGNIHSYTAP